MQLEQVLGMLPDKVPNDRSSDSKVLTPLKIAHEMVGAISNDVWTKDIKIIDIYCKSGVFLYEAYLKLMNSESVIADFPDKKDRHFHIIKNQLYGLCPDMQCQFISMRTVFGRIVENSNIIHLKNYSDVIRNSDREFLNEILKREFKTMQFDIVITNPPYNRGMDLDFVDLGYKLSNKYTCMITPAKWQTAADDYSGCASKNINYKQFREKYVPHMSHVCFYPDTSDVFGIAQVDGITWYIMDKNIHEKVRITNKCSMQKHFNSVAERRLREREFTQYRFRNCA